MSVLFLFLEQHFGSKVEGSANYAFAYCSSLQTAEICDFVSFFDADDVFRFDVAMYKGFAMNGHESFTGVEEYVEEVAQFHVALHGHSVAQGAGAQLEDDVHHSVLFSEWKGRYSCSMIWMM